MITRFFVPGNPTALKRHRRFTSGNFTGTYDPSKTDKQDFLTICYNNRPEKPYTCPLAIKVFSFFKRPKSHYGTGRNSEILKNSAPKYHITRPDYDNLSKFVCDALNGVFWKDDSIICWALSLKGYADTPGTYIEITDEIPAVEVDINGQHREI